jgi:molybdopterin/thiamine biosynthesis adenylyltransferase
MLMSANFAHQEKLFDPRLAGPVVIVGVGMIGSMVAFALAKKGVHDITVIDHDTVDTHNAPMSLYRASDLGRFKVAALANILEYMVPDMPRIEAVASKYTGGELPRATIVCCVDKMEVRRLLWERVRDNRIRHPLFIDTRTAAAYAEVFAVSPRASDDVAWYESEQFWYSDAEAARQMCGEHGIIDVALAVSASVSATVTRFWQRSQKRRFHPIQCDEPQDLGINLEVKKR